MHVQLLITKELIYATNLSKISYSSYLATNYYSGSQKHNAATHRTKYSALWLHKNGSKLRNKLKHDAQ